MSSSILWTPLEFCLLESCHWMVRVLVELIVVDLPSAGVILPVGV